MGGIDNNALDFTCDYNTGNVIIDVIIRDILKI